MRIQRVRFAGYALSLLIVGNAAQAQVGEKTFPVARGSLCVTEGTVESMPGNRLQTESEKMRAYVNTWSSQAIETHFTYLGPTAEVAQLGSGALRLQFGLELRAQDACNLVYAMWRVEPESKVVVSVKRNLGMTKSSECGNRGYGNIKPARGAAVPKLRNGDSHTFGAEMQGDELRVFVDKTEVWEGSVGPEAADLKGPVGIRTDNVKLTFDLDAAVFVGHHPNFVRSCKSDAEGPD